VLRALLLAPPGAGKGTQGERLAKAYRVPHLATGDLLRQHVAAGTEIGLAAQEHMERGELVPDRLVVDLVLSRISEPERLDSFVLDGFPRTLAQAEAAYRWALDDGRTFHVVISLDVPADELVRRLLERGRVAGRPDDTEATIRHRLSVYAASTQPLLDFYERRGILLELDGTGPVDAVSERMFAALEARGLVPDHGCADVT
jgi:adenylate kinase